LVYCISKYLKVFKGITLYTTKFVQTEEVNLNVSFENPDTQWDVNTFILNKTC
jgi:hypothetical protein